MKIGSGYTPGMIYQRHKHATYTPGSKYERFGRLGLHEQRNFRTMNRQAAESYSAAVSSAGPQMFAAKATESQGLSELAAHQLMARVKQAMTALADSASGLGLNDGGNGGTGATTGK